MSHTPSLRLRSAFISDIHLGTRGCRADLLLEFLKTVHVDTLYLVGDVVDMWSLKRNVFWPQAHNNVVRALLGMARHGTRVIFVPGNHDEMFRELAGSVFGNLEIHREYLHETADGRRLLVLHGDEFDGVVKCSRWLAQLGTWVYDLLLWLNRQVNGVRRALGFQHWSLVSHLKQMSRNAVQYIANFEQAVAYAAYRRGVDGVVCGHIHRPALTKLNGVWYCNDGDWVESCSAVVEDLNGRLSLWNWVEQRERLTALIERAA
ncbi:MAG TPA: UDP-2,3-diacylglucosamine diphosphatase [Steroidobacteraceae bacterium]|nr:UDP-2,3-diacylglucosamine diphosphatase [Steroidobacteraceae bacterium]